MRNPRLLWIAIILVLCAGLVAGLVSLGTDGPPGTTAARAPDRSPNTFFTVSTQKAPTNTEHPRLWITAADIPRLRGWAVDSNPLYKQGLVALAANAKNDMDAGHVPNQDEGGATWDQYPSEMYAQLFAFLSLIENDAAARADYAQRARTLLMHVINEAAKGAAAGQPFRDPAFSTSDRSRWWGEGFALTVDWIYPTLSPQDKASIRQVFLRWAQENHNASTTDYNHPQPQDVYSDTVLLADPVRVRWSANNYYQAHMRNLGLMALAFDPADDPDGQLRGYLREAASAWLYVTDHLLRNDARGGLSPEGFEYGPDALGFTAQFLLALRTAGQDNPATWGKQVVWTDNPFWRATVPAFFHSLSPAPTTYADFDWLGPVYQPAWFGDGQDYWALNPVALFGPLGLLAAGSGDTETLDAARWLVRNTPPGGPTQDAFLQRVSGTEVFRDAILTFLLFDPAATPAADPRSGQPTHLYSEGSGRILARTSWDTTASFFAYLLGWITIDHQLAEGNQFAFYRRGEWLTKGRVGWDGTNEACTVGRSDYHNNLALENSYAASAEAWQNLCQTNGSQWIRGAATDGRILAHSFGAGFVYALGNATGLYNNQAGDAADVAHVSRSILWLQPDFVLVYDRAVTQTAGRFKRFWLNLPSEPAISGHRATASTAGGQQIFVTTLLPANASLSVQAMETGIGEANGEPMASRLQVEAPGGPADVRFLHLLQGANAGTTAREPVLIQSSSGAAFTGVALADTAVFFPVQVDASFTELVYRAPQTVQRHLITGLTPGSGYTVSQQPGADEVEMHITAGGALLADSGGVLVWPDAGNATPTPTPTPTPTTSGGRVYLPLVQRSGAASTPTPTASATAAPTRIPTLTPTPTSPAGGGPTVAGCPLLPADNIWNARVDGLPVDANSAAYVQSIGSGHLHADFGSGEWPPGSGAPIGIPFVDVPGAQSPAAVAFTWPDESDPGPYPIPTGAPIEGGPNSNGDRHVLVVDRDSCILYELFNAFPQTDGGWQADAGARFDLRSNALRPDTWTSADAAGLPILPGLVRHAEVSAGEIRHALRFTAPQTRSAHVWPARHDASNLSGSQYPPMGQRFRLRADYDISTFSPAVQVLLRAMKTYGLILADNGSAWYISGAPDPAWDNDVLRELGQVPGAVFEAVDVSSLMVDSDSGQARPYLTNSDARPSPASQHPFARTHTSTGAMPKLH